MKKTFTVNISGQVFHVDDDAFDVLQKYLLSIKQHFVNKEGGTEIIEDIESRIAELMNERTGSSKQAITLDDVKEIIAQLGQPFEIDDDENQEKESKQEPYSYAQPKNQKRFYRDSDHKVIGGVCGGIGAYFNIDPVIIRIVFALAFLVAGSSFWIYVILWIAIPEARTTAEKLEMSGEPVNVDNIEKKIKTEFEDLKSRFGSYKHEAKDAVNNIRNNVHPKTAIENLVSIFGDIFRQLGKVLGVLFGVFFVFLGITITFGLLVSLFSNSDTVEISSFGFHSFSIPQLLDFILNSSSSMTSAVIGLVVFIGLPMIMLIYSGVKLIFGLKFEVKYLGLSVFFLWLASGILLGIVGSDLIIDFSKANSVSESIPIQQPLKNTLYIDLATDSIPQKMLFDEDSENMPISIMMNKNEKLFIGIPEIQFKSSEDSLFKIVVRKRARGKNQLSALNRSKTIQYNLVQKGDTILINPMFFWSKDDVWRNQSVCVTFFCPKGKTVFLNKKLNKIAYFSNDNSFIDSFVEKQIGVDNEELFIPTKTDSTGTIIQRDSVK